jgi:hypothetical protein
VNPAVSLSRGTDLEARDLEALAARWIPPELAEQALLRRVDDREGGTILGRNGDGRYSGILIPYVLPGQTGAREYRVRRDHPDMEGGKPKGKYLSPPGKGNLIYFVPGIDPRWLDDVRLPIIVTEGEFKVLALWRLAHHALGDAADVPRFLPIGLGGVWNWRGTVGKTGDANGARVDEKGPIPDLARIAWKGRVVTIVFDSDLETNSSVCAARNLLTKELQSRGAKIKWLQWPSNLPSDCKGIDDYLAAAGPGAALDLIQHARSPRPGNVEQREASREFVALGDDRYRLAIPDLGILFEIDRLRRERFELVGELSVHCDLPGARTTNGILSAADFNLSSARSRSERARLLADRANTRSNLDWSGLVEEFCQRVLQADRDGQPAVDLRELSRPAADDYIEVDGFALPRRHSTIVFGDGGASKSYTALYLAGRMAKQGIRVALFDWELAGEDHRDRIERLFGPDMPQVMYVRCERPLTSEVDRLKRIVRDHRIEFAVFDSVAFACDGPPEAAEVAGRYFRAVRQVGGGSLHIAHISKGENADKKPFGSAFWHNGARSTWFAKLAEDSQEGDELQVGFFNRKANLGRLRPAVGYVVTFSADRTTFHRQDVADSHDLAGQLPIRQRMAHLLRTGSMTPEAIAEEIGADVESIKRTFRRHKTVFTVVEGGRIGLMERKAS